MEMAVCILKGFLYLDFAYGCSLETEVDIVDH